MTDPSGIEARIQRLEESVARIAARLDDIDRPRAPAADTEPFMRPPRARSGNAAPRAPRFSADNATAVHPLASKSTEWWLARGGAILTLFALILLYQYAVEHDWITPVVRVAAGVLVGAALFVAGTRIARRTGDSDIGLREVLLGAGLSAWYISAYAAAVFYQLIPSSTARLVFLALSILGAWLSLREKRSILAILALGVGFATPTLLPSNAPYIPAFALYLAALAAIGLVLYLMRGWQLVLWLTFISFWWSTGLTAAFRCCDPARNGVHITGSADVARVALSLLIVAAAFAFMRVPVMRRGLLASGSDLYTVPARSSLAAGFQNGIANFISTVSGRKADDDSAALWAFVLMTPLIAIAQLSLILRSAPGWQWGVACLLAAAAAWSALRSPRDADSEMSHVLAAGIALWSLTGAVVVAGSVNIHVMRAASVALIVAAVHAFAVLQRFSRVRYAIPRRLACLTSLVLLFIVLFAEGVNRNPNSPFQADWLVTELVVAMLSFWIWLRRSALGLDRFAKVLGAGSYVALLLIDARVLGLVWPPLVTASYAVAGAALLVLSRSRVDANVMRRLGAVTLIIVVARLLLVDLARVETIWRVLLFLGCGALFLLTSYRLQAAGRELPPNSPA